MELSMNILCVVIHQLLCICYFILISYVGMGDFGVGLVIPLVKDRTGDFTDVCKCRGITLS